LPPRAPEELPSEFAPGADQRPGLDRRELLKLTAASAALAGLGACMEHPHERIMPRSAEAPEQTPGVPVEYATSMVLDGFATGHVVKAMDGRPIKVEGNPEHPASLGGTTALGQASILELYDPDRARGVLERGRPASRAGLARLIASLPAQSGLWFLLYPQSSPLLVELLARVRRRHPSAQVATDTPLDRRAVYRGASMAFGRPLEAQYRFERADVVAALDADFLAAMPGSVRWSRDFAARRRRLAGPGGDPGRLHVAEPSPTPTGSLADHRVALRAGDIGALAAGLLAEIVRGGRAPAGLPPELVARLAGFPAPAPAAAWLSATARDLARSPGRAIVLAGDRQPAETHALVHLINQALGNLGETIALTEPALHDPLGPGLAELVRAAAAGEVQTLVIAEANPLYSAPPDLGLERALARIPLTIHASLHENETSRACTWFLPLAHSLESWGDARAYDGTLSFIQPLIRPLHGGASLVELLAMFAGDPDPSGHALLRDRDRRARGEGGAARDVELAWEEDVRRGFSLHSGFPAQPPRLDIPALGAALVPALATARARSGAEEPIEISFAPSHAVHDGRFANIGWLQELPRPITKLTWGNAAQLGPGLAARLGVDSGDVVRLSMDGRAIEAPALIVPGHADHAVSLELGGGRRGGGQVAAGVGVDAGPLRSAAAPGFARGVRVAATGERRALAITQGEMRAHGRDLAPHTTLAAYRADPSFTRALRGGLPTLLPGRSAVGPQWAMTIDTSICSGCSACVVACQAENNIPIVGRQGVLDHREMHWLRIDTTLCGSADRPDFVHQPMLCQHCQDAPCEYVCPVNATTHSPDGLNEMTYNRCIGTRFCSNNCPYKVRRFNWFDYTGEQAETIQLQRNPNVTVRERGVMEKCTYCVQRIRAVEIQSRIERRGPRPGEVVTACQQACPTGAIQFGALEHAGTPMVEWRREPRRYAALHELGTRPRTMYLARITNPPADTADTADTDND